MKASLSKQIAILLMSAVLLGACGQNEDATAESSKSTASGDAQQAGSQDTARKDQEQVADDVAEQLSAGYYSAVIKDGYYALSDSRGVVAGNTSQANMKNMERGLYQLAQGAFPTDQYALKEGSVISDKEAITWLSAQTKENPDGLNPAKSESTKLSDYEPKYLNSILEFNFTQADKNGEHQLKGIAIALSMNSVDVFTNSDTEEEIVIDPETSLSKGKEMAIKIIARIRENKSYKDVPIQIALFQNKPSGNLAGGSFVAEAISNQGTELSQWVSHEREFIAFNVDEAPNAEDETAFTRFRNNVEGFFPRLSGLAGVGRYEEGKLGQINIAINTQFDGYTEVVALTQFAIDEATNNFRNDVPINITIETPSGVAAVLSREAGSSTFDYVIL